MSFIKHASLASILCHTGQLNCTFLAFTIRLRRFLAKTLLTASLLLAAGSVSAASLSGINTENIDLNERNDIRDGDSYINLGSIINNDTLFKHTVFQSSLFIYFITGFIANRYQRFHNLAIFD